MEKPFPYRIERLRDDLLPDVQQLLAEVLNKRLSLDYIRKKYDTRYTGHQYVCSIAYDGNKPIAFYGTVPQFFKDGKGGRIVGCHACDSMTLASYQRRGVHQQLALETYAWMREEGIQVVYAFHSENTYHSCKKLDWKVWGTLRGYWLKAANFPYAKVMRRLPGLRDVQVARVRKTFGKFAISPSDFPNSQTGAGLSVDYSPEFFASRAFHQNYWVEFSGVKFWLSVDAVVRVGDVHFDSQQSFEAGLAELTRICSRLGYGNILFQTFPGSKLDQALAVRHTGFESWIFGYLPIADNFDFMPYRPNYGDQDSF
ncbi:MAG: hypothetical protein RLZZ519_1690 [Bacteroidota bacterium]|jgi:hypothetical protein